MKKYILISLAALLLLANSMYAADNKKGDWGISITFNPVSLAYKMSCQPAPGDFAGEYITDLASSPKQMFILSQDPLAAIRGKYYLSDKTALRMGFGFNGSVVKYREYVQNDLAVALNPESQNKVTDVVTSRLNSIAMSFGFERKVGSPKIKFVYGADILYAIAGGRMVFSYGNAITDINHIPSSMPITAPQGKLDDFQSKLGIDYARPVERYNSGYIHGIGIQADAGLEFFLTPKIALGLSMTFTPLMATFQPKTYSTYEGFSANTGKVEKVTDVVSPGSCALLYGTENLGCRIALTYYL